MLKSLTNYGKFLKMLLVPAIVEFLVSFGMLVFYLLSYRVAIKMMQLAVGIFIIYSVFILIVVGTAFAKENAAQSLTHHALYHVKSSIDEQISLRLKAIQDEKFEWTASLILFGEALAFTGINISYLLLSPWLSIIGMLIAGGIALYIFYTLFQFSRSEQKIAPTVEPESERNVSTTTIPTTYMHFDELFSIARILKLAATATLVLIAYIIISSILEVLNIMDFPNIGTMALPSNVPPSFFIIAFLLILIPAAISLFLIFIIPYVIFSAIYDRLMKNWYLKNPASKNLRVFLLRSIILNVITALLIVVGYILSLLLSSPSSLTFSVEIPISMSFLSEILFDSFYYFLFFVLEGVILGWMWWKNRFY